MITNPPNAINPSSSILFLGAGFSGAGTNVKDNNIPTTRDLESQLAHLLGLPPQHYRLPLLASHAAKRKPRELYDLLYHSFTSKFPSSQQTDILSRNWLRVYTTNFDDLAENVTQSRTGTYDTYSFNSKKPQKLKDGAIIHLHGSVSELTHDNVSQQLILSDEGYIQQLIEKSLWFDEFMRDLRFSDACFFVGYSLSDHHIAALLPADKTLFSKLYFITEVNPDPLVLDHLTERGNVLSIEVNGFADLLKTLPHPPPQALHTIRAFHYFDPLPRQTATPATAIEVSNLFRYGNFHPTRCAGLLTNSRYIVPRLSKLLGAVAILKSNKSVIIHSRLGNGKTIFVTLLSMQLAAEGYTCFRYRDLNRLLEFGYQASELPAEGYVHI